MPLGDRLTALRRHRMRAYYLPFAAGVVLTASAFLPLLVHDGTSVGAVPAVPALWILALGIGATVLATLSVITRKNSRHPLLVVGLVALGVEFLSWQWTERAVAEQAWVASQASAIVQGGAAPGVPNTSLGPGLWLGVAAAMVIVGFGLTIVVKKAGQPYAPPDDDV